MTDFAKWGARYLIILSVATSWAQFLPFYDMLTNVPSSIRGVPSGATSLNGSLDQMVTSIFDFSDRTADERMMRVARPIWRNPAGKPIMMAGETEERQLLAEPGFIVAIGPPKSTRTRSAHSSRQSYQSCRACAGIPTQPPPSLHPRRQHCHGFK